MTERPEADHERSEFDRRAFVKRMALAAFAIPVVASFKLDSLAQAAPSTRGKHPGQYFPNQTVPNQYFPNQHFPNQHFPNQHLPPHVRRKIRRLLRKLRRRKQRRRMRRLRLQRRG
ncbi:MAG: hypothetical protein ACR2OD_08020 [Gaiellaceae bacterium]